MLDMGFQPQIKRILERLPKDRQTMLFSATLPHEIMAIATKYMKLPVRIEVAPPGTAAQNVSQEIFIVRKDAKPKLLEKVLRDYSGSTLIFARTKYAVKKVTRLVNAFGHSAAEIHGNRSQMQRRDALAGFKSGKYRVLVATDIASRGIDVRGIELVINFDFPAQSEDYVHRIGRTGRAGAEGHAISFALPEERNDIRAVERLIRKTLPVSTHNQTGETSPQVAASLAAFNAPRGREPQGGRGRGHGGRGRHQSFGPSSGSARPGRPGGHGRSGGYHGKPRRSR
ncbi:MAG: DEAD/DEAH box helicase, partial [Parcubacteria group bacterium]|nr:DEAD/DEAH box helicase [Parcubacteria group bacterium]